MIKEMVSKYGEKVRALEKVWKESEMVKDKKLQDLFDWDNSKLVIFENNKFNGNVEIPTTYSLDELTEEDCNDIDDLINECSRNNKIGLFTRENGEYYFAVYNSYIHRDIKNELLDNLIKDYFKEGLCKLEKEIKLFNATDKNKLN
ncbi:hypothetical protein G8T75_12810 [Clostridium botulinum D/C]|uniref:hypothetical protein n=1 Tax=Clostridium botulinum TaxID=1491 RepID=UPI001E40C551|nr:hypothetical protein [Clostridium botulinum]MCD3240838.1 hypothetical protein [Clostridium botulinum D/C]